MSGVSLSDYWIGNLFSDLTLYYLSVVICLVILFCARVDLFTGKLLIGVITIFTLFGVLAVITGYILSFFFSKSETANKWYFLIFLFRTYLLDTKSPPLLEGFIQ